MTYSMQLELLIYHVHCKKRFRQAPPEMDFGVQAAGRTSGAAPG